MQLTPIVERAYQLAQSGECDDVEGVKRRLLSDGYTGREIQTHFYGSSLNGALRKLCIASRPAADENSASTLSAAKA